jgi:hypothetical protein
MSLATSRKKRKIRDVVESEVDQSLSIETITEEKDAVRSTKKKKGKEKVPLILAQLNPVEQSALFWETCKSVSQMTSLEENEGTSVDNFLRVENLGTSAAQRISSIVAKAGHVGTYGVLLPLKLFIVVRRDHDAWLPSCSHNHTFSFASCRFKQVHIDIFETSHQYPL